MNSTPPGSLDPICRSTISRIINRLSDEICVDDENCEICGGIELAIVIIKDECGMI